MKQNSNSSDGTKADSDIQPIVNSSADIAVNPLLAVVLSSEEILEGNRLLLGFMEFDTNKSDRWIIECSLYDRSWDEIMKVAEKISTTYGEYSDGINSRIFYFKHMMFHEIIGNRNYLYKRCVNWVKHYNSVVSQNHS